MSLTSTSTPTTPHSSSATSSSPLTTQPSMTAIPLTRPSTQTSSSFLENPTSLVTMTKDSIPSSFPVTPKYTPSARTTHSVTYPSSLPAHTSVTITKNSPTPSTTSSCLLTTQPAMTMSTAPSTNSSQHNTTLSQLNTTTPAATESGFQVQMTSNSNPPTIQTTLPTALQTPPVVAHTCSTQSQSTHEKQTKKDFDVLDIIG